MQQKLPLGDPFQFLGKPQATHTHCFSTGEGLCWDTVLKMTLIDESIWDGEKAYIKRFKTPNLLIVELLKKSLIVFLAKLSINFK